MLHLGIDQYSKLLTMNVHEESGQIVRRKQVGMHRVLRAVALGRP